jgi:serine protease AprX
MKNNLKKLVIGLILCTLCIPTALTVNGNTELFQKNSKIINERLITIPDTLIILKLWDKKLNTDEIVPFYSISIDGGKSFVRTVQPSYEIGLRYAHFDPLKGEPFIKSILTANENSHLFIVQFVTQPLQEFRDAITTYGGVVRHYIAQYAYLVEMSESVRAQVEALPYVRWVGPYHPAYRLEEFMHENLENAYQKYPLQRYNIQVLSVAQKTIVAERIETIGGIVDSADAGKFLVVATLTPDQLFQVARWDEINFIDRWSPLEADMDIAREIGGANYIETVAGYNGSGVRGEVFDGGFNLNHVDFQSRPLILHGSVGSATHGAATSGICFGDGTGDPKARGLLPEGQGIVGDYNYIGLSGTNRYTHTGEEVQDPYDCVFETCSAGDTQTTQYTTISADADDTLFDFDILKCQSQSNTGNQNSRPQAWAKNMVSVGGVYHYDTLTKADDKWNGGGSIGPASDGTIKPDLCHFYDMIWTTYSSSPTGYGQFSGTSGATPITAGHFGLFFEMWSDGIFGNEVDPNGTVFDNRPHMTTAKAMMINTADQYPFNGTSEDHTRMHQGWGMASVKNLYDLRNNFYIIDESDILEPFDVSSHTVSVPAGSPSLKVTMTYADPAGNPSVQSQHRINDLSLKVISPSQVTYWGNYGLKTGVWSTPNGTADTKDTVECVFVQNPEAGSWTVQVSADEIIQDSHVETPEMDADYALVVSPVSSGPLTPTINGPTEGNVGQSIEFTVETTDPAGGDLLYYIDWGDGTSDDWFGPYNSGEVVTIEHTWANKGSFTLLAKAKNTYGTESEWSLPFAIEIFGATLSLNFTGGGKLFKISAVLKNIGVTNATNIQWSIKLGSKAIFGKNTNGIIPTLAGGAEQVINSKIIFGFGSTQINITATFSESNIQIERNATLFMFFIKVAK